MSRGRVLVQFLNGKPERIYKRRPDYTEWNKLDIRELPRGQAISMIRERVFERANNYCEKCLIAQATEMHEKKIRSLGGEYSMENCWALCPRCHDAEHADRTVRWT